MLLLSYRWAGFCYVAPLLSIHNVSACTGVVAHRGRGSTHLGLAFQVCSLMGTHVIVGCRKKKFIKAVIQLGAITLNFTILICLGVADEDHAGCLRCVAATYCQYDSSNC